MSLRDGAVSPPDSPRLSSHHGLSPFSVETDDHVDKKIRKNFGGREDLLLVYRKAKELIIAHDLMLFKQVAHVGDEVHLTICNLWRIEKALDKNWSFSEKDLNTNAWIPVSDLEGWPSIPLWPLQVASKPDYWRELIYTVVWKALNVAGFQSLPRDLPGWAERPWNHNVWDKKRTRFPMRPHAMARCLIEAYRGTDKRPGFLKRETMEKAARALRAAFFEHIHDKELFSALLVVDFRVVPFLRYLQFGQHRDAVLRIARERRNLLPLLPWIKPSQWSRDDLFARKHWVRGNRKTTIVDRPAFRRCASKKTSRQYVSSFVSASAWRWLSNASPVVVRAWLESESLVCAQQVMEAIVAANVTQRVPVMMLMAVVRNSDVWKDGVTVERFARFLRVTLLQSAKLWKDRGFKDARAFALGYYTFGIRDTLDYLIAEGFEQGIPDKNSTWASLYRRSQDWHARVRIEKLNQDEESARRLTWPSLLENVVIDDVVFKALTSAWDLAVEGYDMHHCVGMYTDACMSGESRIFSVLGRDEQRATLELSVARKKVSIRQLKGKHNNTNIAGFEAMEKACKKLAKRYEQSLKDIR
jgi:hypothetical protein